MVRRLAAIFCIFLCTAIAWAVLGSTIFYRTYDAGSALSSRVQSSWGAPEEQTPPCISYSWTEKRQVQVEEKGKKTTKTEDQTFTNSVPLDSSRIQTSFHIDYRQKGLLWFSAYQVDFTGAYTFSNSTAIPRDFTFRLPLPAKESVYDNVVLIVNGQPLPVVIDGSDATATLRLPPGSGYVLKTGYRSQGLDSWRYKFGQNVSQARDFHLTATTDFSGFDFPENSLSPTQKQQTAQGWQLSWDYQNLVSGFDIALKMPQKLQPGPLAGRISYFAPVSLFFFFFLMVILTTLRGIDLHPLNYFFLACAFFAFHLLLAYLADHISIHLAFFISSAVSIALVVTYLRLVTGLRFALVEAGLAQLIYLVLFSYAFFFEGFTGLVVTIGAILTLFVLMQMTGRIRWDDKLAKPIKQAQSA
jgi:inner membrane protein involved in colicin E2 resistance